MHPAKAAELYPNFISYDSSLNIIDIFMDHHMLSDFRMCEARFTLNHMANLHLKGEGTLYRNWNLEFGSLLHDCFFLFYDFFKKDQKAPPLEEWLNECAKLWDERNFNYFENKEPRKWKIIQGRDGFLALMVQWYATYHDYRLRVVGTEIAFGRGKEVSLGEFGYRNYLIRCWLTGRVDVVVDNGYKIGPVDHKHTEYFRGDESSKFLPHEGITGYIYAINSILKQRFPEYYESHGRRGCRDGWIFHISDKQTSQLSTERFKATPICKTADQLEEYRLRQLRTIKKICDIIIGDEVPDWNTNICKNIYMRDCEFRILHESTSDQFQQLVQLHYEKRTPWTAENMRKKE